MVPDYGADERMEEAIAECVVYGKMGGLDEVMLRDIAHDNDVDLKELKEKIEWDL